MKRTYDDVVNYVENQSNGKCKVISAKPEHSFDDLGIIVNVWNFKTDVDGDWWGTGSGGFSGNWGSM